MRLFVCLAVAAAAILSSATQVFAQDSNPFEGPYLGLEAGVDLESLSLASIPTPPVAFDGKITNGVFGIDAGYNFAFGNDGEFLAGVEGHAALTTAFDGSNRIFGVAGRVGYMTAPRSMIFARAGYANFKNGSAVGGFQAGGGYETFIGDNLSLKAEYRYLNFADRVFVFMSGDPIIQVVTTASQHNHQMILGLNWHF